MSAQQQGDCRFVEVDLIPKTARLRQKKGQWNVLAFGESTGHKHLVIDEEVEIYEDADGTLYVKSSRPVDVVHEEHNKVTLKPGIQRMRQVREKDHLNDLIRTVRD